MASNAAVANTNKTSDNESRIAKRMGEAGTQKRAARRKMVTKIFGLLSKTPGDDKGMVEGTPFSVTGVERLMSVLKARAENPSASGNKAAERMITFLAAEDGSADAIAGASVDKLLWIAKMGKRFNK